MKDNESPTKKSTVKSKLGGGDPYYFYQASDGQHLYLHPLDIKVLKYEFGDYESFPNQIKLPIISIVESTVDNVSFFLIQDLRKRCKYLSHIPLSCDVNFCEVDLPHVVSIETSSNFDLEISSRFQKLLCNEQKRMKETRKQRYSIKQEYATSPSYEETAEFRYDENEFGPPLSTSPEQQIFSTQSTPPRKTFANIAMDAGSNSLPTIWQKPVEWKLEIPQEALASISISPNGKGKKKKKILLFGNGGSRTY
jgi:hypothetical protein